MQSLNFRAALLSLLIFVVLLLVWQLATQARTTTAAPVVAMTPEQIEYARLMGKPVDAAPAAAKSGFPTPL